MKAITTGIVIGIFLFSCSNPNSIEPSPKSAFEEGGDTSYVYEGIYKEGPISTSVSEFMDGQNQPTKIESFLFSENDTGIVLKTSTITDKMKQPTTTYRKFHNRRIELLIHHSTGIVDKVNLHSSQMINERGFKLERRINSIHVQEVKNDSLYAQISTDDLSTPIGSNNMKHAFAIPMKEKIQEIKLIEL